MRITAGHLTGMSPRENDRDGFDPGIDGLVSDLFVLSPTGDEPISKRRIAAFRHRIGFGPPGHFGLVRYSTTEA